MSDRRAPRIEEATLDNFEEVFFLLMEMHKEVGLCKLDRAKTVDAIQATISHGQVFLAFRGNDLIGSIGAEYAAFWYSDEVFLQDKWFYVRPGFRASKAAQMLLLALRDFAYENAYPLCCGVTSEKDLDRKINFMSRHMQHAGALFVEGF